MQDEEGLCAKEGYHDTGCGSTDIVRYPYYAARVCEALVRGEAARGILICSTGIGMSSIANRYRGICAALCTSTYMATTTHAHNDSNDPRLGGQITGEFEALDILEAWLAPSACRHPADPTQTQC